MKSEAFEAEESRFASGIQRICHHRMLKGLEMHAALVCPTCLWLRLYKGDAFVWIALKYFEIRDGITQFSFLTTLCRPLAEVRSTFADSEIDSAPVLLHQTVHKQMIDFFYLAILELTLQALETCFGLRQNQNAGSISVYTMHYTGTLDLSELLAHVSCFRILLYKPFCNTLLFRPTIWVHDKTRGLIEHEYVSVFVENIFR